MVAAHAGRAAVETPSPPAMLVGRGEQQRLLEELCADHRAVTLTGLRGVGKSTLARAVAASMGGRAAWLDLSGLTSLEALWERLRGRSSEAPRDWQALADLLHEGGVTLVVLDDVDDVALGARCQEELRAHRPEVCVLSTACRALGVADERVLALRALGYPEPGELELDSPRWPALGLWLALTPELGPRRDLELSVRLVRELDGLPLALTLAAPRARLLGERALLDSLGERFEWLRRRAPSGARHASLGDVFESTWSELAQAERRALAGLRVFRGGFLLEAGAAVLGLAHLEFWDLLEELVSRGLVEGEALRRADVGRRFHVLRSLALHLRGHERGDAAVRRDHALFFAAWAERSPDFSELRDEAQNLSLAAEWLASLDTPSEAQSAALLRVRVAQVRLRWASGPHGELAPLVERALAKHAGVAPELRLRARLAQSADLRRASRLDEALRVLGVAQEEAPATLPEALASELGAVEAALGATRDAERALESAIARPGGDLRERTKLQIRLADLLHRHSTHRRARELLEQATQQAEAQGYPELEVSARLNLANVCVSEAAFTEGRAQIGRARQLARSMRHEYFQAYAQLASAHLEQAAGEDARALAEQASRALTQAGHARDAGVAESQLTLMALEAGDVAQALAHARKALRLLADHPIPFLGLTRARYAAALAEAGRMGDATEEWQSAWAGLGADSMGTEALAARVHHGHLRLGAFRSALERGDAEAASVAREQVEAALRAPSREQELAVEVRLAQRVLEACMRRQASSASGCIVQADGRGVTPAGEERVGLSRRGALRRILERLAHAHQVTPGVGVDPDAIFEAGWPGQSIHPDQAGARVYNAIFELRRSGLGEQLLRHDDGYLLCPDTVQVVSAG